MNLCTFPSELPTINGVVNAPSGDKQECVRCFRGSSVSPLRVYLKGDGSNFLGTTVVLFCQTFGPISLKPDLIVASPNIDLMTVVPD